MKPEVTEHKDIERLPGNFRAYLAAQKKLVLVGITISTVLFLLIKFLFPHPDFFLDSYAYVKDAYLKSELTYRPRGYACFLELIHHISAAAGLTVVIQYCLFLFSSVFFFLSCDFLFGLPVKLRKAVFILLVANPILLLQTNMISSDSLFCSLTVIWFGICLWSVATPHWLLVPAQLVLLVFCFHVRYTAIYFPAIAVIFYTIGRGKMIYKLVGIALTIGTIYYVTDRQKDRMEQLTGIRIMSAFSGWQIINNVLCYYRDIDVEADDLPTVDARVIDTFVKNDIGDLYYEDNIGTHYLWGRKSPLKHYLITRIQAYHSTYGYEWIVCAKLYSEYAWSVIRHDPWAYARYFMGRNFKNFLFPDREVLANYDRWHAGIPPETKAWFGFDIDYLECRFPDLQEKIIYPYPVVSFLINLSNVLMISLFLFTSIRHRRNMTPDNWWLLLSWSVFYFSFMLFCLFSTVVLLRYLDPLFTLGIIMPFVLWHRIDLLRKDVAGEPAAAS